MVGGFWERNGDYEYGMVAWGGGKPVFDSLVSGVCPERANKKEHALLDRL